jgi:hypothetical protein
MTPYAGDIQIPLPESTVAVSKPQFGHAAHSIEEQPLSDAIENVCYDSLSLHDYGWEDNDGAYGEFIFDVA